MWLLSAVLTSDWVIQLYFAKKGRKTFCWMLTGGGDVNQNTPLAFGGVPEWPKGSDCKSDGSAFGGSNPPPSTKI
jgi:hypothetical protein